MDGAPDLRELAQEIRELGQEIGRLTSELARLRLDLLRRLDPTEVVVIGPAPVADHDADFAYREAP